MTGASANGNGTDLDDCKAKFKAAWMAIRADLSDDDIARPIRQPRGSPLSPRYPSAFALRLNSATVISSSSFSSRTK
jgi:hypothetical protein